MLLSSHGSCSVGSLLRGGGNEGNAGSRWDSEKILLTPAKRRPMVVLAGGLDLGDRSVSFSCLR